MSKKFVPLIISAEMAALGYNNEGRGKLRGYISDPEQHDNSCPYRLDPRATCACRIGLWQEQYDTEPHEAPKKLRDKTSVERKAEPVHSGVLMYFPDALAAVARVSKAGNDKHNPGEPLHWARNKSTDQMDCAARHMLTPEAIDAETGEPELAQAAWRLLAQLQMLEEIRLTKAGIKPYSGIVP